MSRTTPQAVESIIERDPNIPLEPFLETATCLTDFVESEDDEGLLTEELLEKIERHLAAHFYHHRDRPYASKTTGRASAVFQGQFGKGLEATIYGQTAMLLDVTGTLAGINAGRKKVKLMWLGVASDSPRPDGWL